MSNHIKREIFLHYPTIDMAHCLVNYHNFSGIWYKESAYLLSCVEDNTPTEEGLFKRSFNIMYTKIGWFKNKYYKLGRLTFLYEKASIGRNIVHEVHIDACGLCMSFQTLKKDFEEYYGKDRVTLKFISDEPLEW